MPVKTEIGHEQYVSSVMEKRAKCDDYIVMAKIRFQDPYRWDRPLNQGDGLYTLHSELNASIFDYHSELRMYSKEVGELWERPIESPFEGKISPANLRGLDLGVRAVHENVPIVGSTAQTKVEKYETFLPLILCEAIRDRLNECVLKLGLFPGWEPDYLPTNIDEVAL